MTWRGRVQSLNNRQHFSKWLISRRLDSFGLLCCSELTISRRKTRLNLRRIVPQRSQTAGKHQECGQKEQLVDAITSCWSVKFPAKGTWLPAYEQIASDSPDEIFQNKRIPAKGTWFLPMNR
ncbi:uncharacterized protein LOC144181364 isoform X2 [Stigmatopora nigra]